MKVLFLTNLPSPYRVDFFNELAKKCELTVSYEVKLVAHRNIKWKNSEPVIYKEIYLNSFRLMKKNICFEILQILKNKFDCIIIGGYSTPTVMLAIEYMRLNKIPFWLEVDGGFIKDDKKLVYQLKKHLISSANGWFSTGKYTTNYLLHYGALKNNIVEYSFTSLKKKDLLKEPPTIETKAFLRKKLGLHGSHIIVSVGQFIFRKGFDLLIKALANCPKEYHLYIIGDEPTKEYLELKETLQLDNLHFVGFKSKPELKEYYMAADLFVLPTREDIWGLVINEAMSNGLPVITTDHCIAGLELIKNGLNGFIVPVNDYVQLTKRIIQILSDSKQLKRMSMKSLISIHSYTIENMSDQHLNALKEFQQ